MKKILIILMALLVLFSVTGCKKQDAFVLGLDDSFPPMGFRNDANEIVGYDIDLAAEACKRLNLELVCQPIDWAAKEQELNTGNIDCIWNGFTMTPERLEALSFTKAYLDNVQVVIVRGDSGYKTLADLAGKSVGLQAGSSAADALYASEFSGTIKDVVEFKDNLTALMDLEIGGVDAVVMDMVVGNYNIKTSGKNFVVLSETLSTEEYGIGFRKGNTSFCRFDSAASIDNITNTVFFHIFVQSILLYPTV